MKNFTNSIRNSIKTENWYGAVSLALTLPDICGRLENPEIKSSQKRTIQWFKKWLEPKYTSRIGAEREEHIFLCGNDFYALRCSFLHQGESNIEMQRCKEILNDFQFTPPVPGLCIHRNQRDNKLQLQVDIFCEEIAEAVDNWSDFVKNNSVIQNRIKSLLAITMNGDIVSTMNGGVISVT